MGRALGDCRSERKHGMEQGEGYITKVKCHDGKLGLLGTQGEVQRISQAPQAEITNAKSVVKRVGGDGI